MNSESSIPAPGSSIDPLARYRVELVPASDIQPSPENEELYGHIDYQTDTTLQGLVASIRKRGLEEPLILSLDGFIVSGHRRYVACMAVGMDPIPCRRTDFKRSDCEDWHRVLAEYNPQRVKGVDALLKETMLRESVEQTQLLMEERQRAAEQRIVDQSPMNVEGTKLARNISARRKSFLDAVIKVVNDREEFWPLSVRGIHYALLNDPPLTVQTSKRSGEKHRYRNNKASSKALERLCRDARYAGLIPMDCIDDATRPQILPRGFKNVQQFIRQEVEGFLLGYHRDRMQSQPQYIEVFGEKNTLRPVLEPICREYSIPLVLGRGFCSVSVWRDIERRWRASGKDSMTLLIISDYDPEGLELADDAIRSLRDLHGVLITGIRVAVTKEQIANFNLGQNPAKESSPRYKSFLKRTGSTATYECEALEPTDLQAELQQAIENVIDSQAYEAELEAERKEIEECNKARRTIVEGF